VLHEQLLLLLQKGCCCSLSLHLMHPLRLQMEAWQHIKPLAWLDRLINMPAWKVRYGTHQHPACHCAQTAPHLPPGQPCQQRKVIF
jgi:hypothetical protein